jgi:hypothetical protein
MGIAAGEPEWHLASVPSDVDEVDLWELCHQLQSKGMGITGGGSVAFAEPDLQQQWIYTSADEGAAKEFRAMAAADACQNPDPPNSNYPAPNPMDWRWYLGGSFSGLDSARTLVGNPADKVVIAHLDTGYRKGHSVLPKFLDEKLQHSFVDGDPDVNNASDPGQGGLNPGHGTGTLSILAGSMFNGAAFQPPAPSGVVGGAPFARVIPVRVANSVVSFASSAIAQGIRYAIDNGADVLSMSMGGVPSQAWIDVVNQAYEAGLVMVTAAGNNFGIGKVRVPRFIVYPARFQRVIATCGVMFDKKPYADFPNPKLMGGSYGPDSKMDTAMAAFTPNVAWAKYACPAIVDFDGAGTSSATPQIAAAAACWLQINKSAVAKYPEKWMRIEAVRQALFSKATNSNREHFGRGLLRANDALSVAPPAVSTLKKTAPDSVAAPVLGGIFHDIFGVTAVAPAQRMLQLEAAQVLTRSGEAQEVLIKAGVDPDSPKPGIDHAVRRQLADAIASHSSASPTLRRALGASARVERPQVPVSAPPGPTDAEKPVVPPPPGRKLRVFALDPAMRMDLKTERLAEATLEVPWEPDLQPGPVGEYLEVVDVDPSSNACYAPVDLNHPHILATNGLDPAEGVPQFHQQMVYAVAMTTIGTFEKALGRTALWAPHIPTLKKDEKFRSYYVQRLRIYPHALREANAFYSPPKKSLLFGYFQAREANAGLNLPGGLVFGCLSQDIVAHETTHALVDGLHRYYQEQTNPDMPAFHEAFADIVAMFQHFTMPESLRKTIAETRGDLSKENKLAELAQQFGQATSGSKALRTALGKKAEVTDYDPDKEPHELGAVLVSAVFQAFLEMYQMRVEDLKRLATGGRGILGEGDISVDLVERMAQEASLTAGHILTACIRALDYCPPVDLTFGDYLRALITADMDISPEDAFNYRTAFISGFRARGIYPEGVRNFSEENLRWQPPTLKVEPKTIRAMLDSMNLSWNLFTNRRESYELSEANGRVLWEWLRKHLGKDYGVQIARDLGIYLTKDAVSQDTKAGRLKDITIPEKAGTPVVEIHSVRPARRIDSRGQAHTDLIIEAVQKFSAKNPDNGPDTWHRGGCTVIVDLQHEQIRYAIRKRVGKAARVAAQQHFMGMAAEGSQSYFEPSQSKEPFAMLHRGV